MARALRIFGLLCLLGAVILVLESIRFATRWDEATSERNLAMKTVERIPSVGGVHSTTKTEA